MLPGGGRRVSRAHLGREVVLLQLPALPQVPGAHSVVQAPGPQLGAVMGNVYAAGPICVALELPRRAKQGGGVSPGEPLVAKPAASDPMKKLRPRRVCSMCPWSPSELAAEAGLASLPAHLGVLPRGGCIRRTSQGGHSCLLHVHSSSLSLPCTTRGWGHIQVEWYRDQQRHGQGVLRANSGSDLLPLYWISL